MPDGPERRSPALALKARTLVQACRAGVLATKSRRMPGHPFASITPYAADVQGSPIFLMSRLAVHTKNILQDPRASLLVFEPDSIREPLASPRLNRMGEVREMLRDNLEAARLRYVEAHPGSAEWIAFGDFSLYRLAIAEVYYVRGFGEMSWLSADDYAGAKLES
jgi:putative heme iron utilization protein